MPLAASVLALSMAAPASSPSPGPLALLRFLIGTWEGTGGSKDATGSGRFSFREANQGHAILRTSSAEYPATADHPASRHDDLMIVYADGAEVRADYADSEDHAIHYRVAPAAEGGVVFVSDPSAKGPRYRLTYKPGAAGTIDGAFEVAPPGQPEAFKPYLAWSARRVVE
jgi:hypothetical protein